MDLDEFICNTWERRPINKDDLNRLFSAAKDVLIYEDSLLRLNPAIVVNVAISMASFTTFGAFLKRMESLQRLSICFSVTMSTTAITRSKRFHSFWHTSASTPIGSTC